MTLRSLDPPAVVPMTMLLPGKVSKWMEDHVKVAGPFCNAQLKRVYQRQKGGELLGNIAKEYGYNLQELKIAMKAYRRAFGLVTPPTPGANNRNKPPLRWTKKIVIQIREKLDRGFTWDDLTLHYGREESCLKTGYYRGLKNYGLSLHESKQYTNKKVLR